MVSRRRRRISAWSIAALSLLLSGCSFFTSCGDNIVGKDLDVGPKTNHSLNCHCRIFYSTECETLGGLPATTDVPLNICLPANLNTAFDAGADQLSDTDYESDVVTFCEQEVSSEVETLAYYINSEGCNLNCIDHVQCEPQALPSGIDTAANPLCDVPCENVQCIAGKIPDGGIPDGGIAPNDAGIGNCDPDKVVSTDDSTVNPEFCKCTQTGPDCKGSSANFCIPAPGNIDPPTLRAGLLTQLVSKPISIDLDHDASSGVISVNFNDGADIPHSDTETIHVNGNITLFGQPCPGSDCDLLMSMSLYPDDTTFNFSDVVCGITCLHDVHAQLAKANAVGGMQSIRVHIASDGTGHIPINALHIHAEAIASGLPDTPEQRVIFDQSNSVALDFIVDWAHNTFLLPGAPFNFDNGGGTLTLSGSIVNKPPTAVLQPTQVVECNEPGSGAFVLDGTSSTDPDGDTLQYNWWKGEPFTGVAIANTPTVSLAAPLGTTTYRLSVADKRFALAFAKTDVTVQDTTAPVISGALEPDCLWPPDGKMVLFSLGSGGGLDASATDACDPNPTLKIVNVTNNQSSAGPPDVEFGTGAFCVRSERNGSSLLGRRYTVTLQATDATGNVSISQIVVSVPHDEARGAHCAKLDKARIVDDNDPRCVADVGGMP